MLETILLALFTLMLFGALSAWYRDRSANQFPGRSPRTTVLPAAFGLAVLLLCGTAGAQAVAGEQTVAGATTVSLQWAAASGPVAGYGVFISRNGAPYPASPDVTTSTTAAQVTGAYGDSITVRVAAFSTSGTYGPFSPDSDPIRFVPLSSVAQTGNEPDDVAVVDAPSTRPEGR